MDSATQLLEKAIHCLDASDWPFSVAEVLARLSCNEPVLQRCWMNRIDFVATSNLGIASKQLHAHQEDERKFNFEWQRALRFGFPSSCDSPTRWQAGDAGSVCRTLDRRITCPDGTAKNEFHRVASSWSGYLSDGSEVTSLHRRRFCLEPFVWQLKKLLGLDSEVGFWHALMDPASETNQDVDAAAWQRYVSWHYGDICAFVEKARAAADRQFGHPRVLNAGSGPLAPKDIVCQEGKAIPVVAADGLARFYMQLYDILGHEPPAVPAQCPTELLHQCFPQHHFDVVHVRNSLDHANDPLLGIRQMIHVVRPGGWVLLRHAQNEGVAGHFQLGLHQWAFDVEDAADGPHFVIWGPSLRADVTRWLLSSNLAAEVRAELRPHPSGGPEPYVWVDIRKPLL
ncbi:SHOC2 [Symbiodinium pilosum]|uniref:SHOC2 protein n=1 Tax=Symbiodinium pilosum TaxID=2952 RepID=A0A812IRM6_SYMPI|nr:SHOC2 [Symbiodinium pilosum]